MQLSYQGPKGCKNVALSGTSAFDNRCMCPPLILSQLTKSNVSSVQGINQGKTTGLIQHVLTVLVFWFRVVLVPWLPGLSRSPRCTPELVSDSRPLRANSRICSPQLPDHPSKTGRTAQVCCNTGGDTPNQGLCSWTSGNNENGKSHGDQVHKSMACPTILIIDVWCMHAFAAIKTNAAGPRTGSEYVCLALLPATQSCQGDCPL